MVGNNPGAAHRVQLIERTLANGATAVSDIFPCYTNARIVGTIYSNQVVTVQVCQGPSEANYGDYSETLVTSGDGNFGAGNKLNFPLYNPEGYGQVRVTNNSGATATIRVLIGLSTL